jgi:mannose-6-phosphate isomerase class I
MYKRVAKTVARITNSYEGCFNSFLNVIQLTAQQLTRTAEIKTHEIGEGGFQLILLVKGSVIVHQLIEKLLLERGSHTNMTLPTPTLPIKYSNYPTRHVK